MLYSLLSLSQLNLTKYSIKQSIYPQPSILEGDVNWSIMLNFIRLNPKTNGRGAKCYANFSLRSRSCIIERKKNCFGKVSTHVTCNTLLPLVTFSIKSNEM